MLTLGLHVVCVFVRLSQRRRFADKIGVRLGAQRKAKGGKRKKKRCKRRRARKKERKEIEGKKRERERERERERKMKGKKTKLKKKTRAFFSNKRLKEILKTLFNAIRFIPLARRDTLRPFLPARDYRLVHDH